MEVNDTDGQVIEQTSNRPDRGRFAQRRIKMTVTMKKNDLVGNLNTTLPDQGHCTARRTNMTGIKRNLVTLGIFVGIVGTPLATALGDTCKGNDPVSPTKHICATWDEVTALLLEWHSAVSTPYHGETR